MEPKVILITNIPTPYRIPFFNELNKLCKKNALHLKIIFGSKAHERRKWEIDEKNFEFDHDFLNKDISTRKFNFYQGIIKKIRKEKPTYVIVSGFSMASLKVVLCSYFIKFNLILWTGSILPDYEKESIFKRLYRKFILLHVKRCIVYSSFSKKYLLSYGIDSEKISISLNTVDLGFFKNSVKKKDPSDVIHLTTVSYLRKAKNTEVLIHIFDKLSKMHDHIVFHIIGDGENRSSLETLVKSKNLENKIIFHGYKQRSELPEFLAQTDIFLFETLRDVWGLILNEAMAAGLCCLSSINAPSSSELIEDGKNGYIVDFKEVDKVVDLISTLITDNALRTKIGSLAQQTVFEKASIEKSALDFYTGIVNE